MLTLLASAERTSSGTAALTMVPHLEQVVGIEALLTVSAAATDGTDTLDVYLQKSVDGGTTYDDVLHFTQVLGNGGAKTFLGQWRAGGMTPESELHVPADASLAAGVLQGGIPAADWRLKWVIVDGGGSVASFTFTVTGQVQRSRG